MKWLLSVQFALAVTPAIHAADDPSYVVGRVLGGLGNQLFQVAATCALAWDHGVEPYFPEFAHVANDPNSYYRHHFFRCKIVPPSRQISRDWSGASPYGYYPIPYEPEMRISGYLQSDQYFAHQRDRLLELFAPRPDDLQTVKAKYGWIINHPCSVSVHLRYYHAEKPNEFLQYDREYYEKAMNLFPNESLFVVTSDNSDFAHKTIPSEGRHVVFIEGEPYSIDFWLQSLCKHNIISNSTFSWWSAWLNQNPEKIVVRPRIWMYGNQPDIGGPPEWIHIDAAGMRKHHRNFHSQAFQDQFVYTILYHLLGKRDPGYYLEIGAGEPISINNTYFFEKELQWSGISLDIGAYFRDPWYAARNNPLLIEDATKSDYRAILKSFPRIIDYLTLDVDGAYTDVLERVSHGGHIFRIITIEHDFYRFGNSYREKERQMLTALGYYLLCPDVSIEGSSFEDWWIHPDCFSSAEFSALTSLDLKAKGGEQIVQAIQTLLPRYANK